MGLVPAPTDKLTLFVFVTYCHLIIYHKASDLNKTLILFISVGQEPSLARSSTAGSPQVQVQHLIYFKAASGC